MRKTVWALFGCLAGLLTGIVYFFGTTIIYDLAEYAVEMLLLAVVGFIFFVIAACAVFWFAKKKSKPFAIAFIVTAFIINIAVLITLGSIRYYPPESIPTETTAEGTAGNNLNGEYAFPMKNHLHTFSFDGKAFTPADDFMLQDTVISGLDESVYFKVDDLCAYARELTELSDEQIDKITAFENKKTIYGSRYICLIDLGDVGINTIVGWAFSSHTPVSFFTNEPDVTSAVTTD